MPLYPRMRGGLVVDIVTRYIQVGSMDGKRTMVET